jgi:hypothetical protein
MEQETIDQVVQELAQKYVPVVATPLKDGGSAPVLDEETYNTLLGMLKSNDEGNHKMAQLILNTCDIQKSIYWLWKITREGWITNNMVNLRTKASRSFRDLSNLYSICNMPPLRFAEFCNNKSWLTSEIYMKLEDDIIETLSNKFTNTFYDVDFKIKNKYEHLPLTKTTIKNYEETGG